MQMKFAILSNKKTDEGNVYLVCANPGKANKETFHVMAEGEDEAFFSTIRKEQAQKYFDALGTGETVQL